MIDGGTSGAAGGTAAVWHHGRPMISSPLALAATLAAAAAAGFWLERRFRWARAVGASLLVIVLGALLSNLRLVPLHSPVYDAVFGPVTSLAIVWLLLAVDLRDLRTAGPRMLAAFGIAVAGTATGALVATLLFADAFEDVWRLAGVMTGTYSGGSLNFVSVGRAVELPESLFAAATAADNVMTAVWMAATLALPVWLRRLYPAPPPEPRRGAAAGEGDGEPAAGAGEGGEPGRSAAVGEGAADPDGRADEGADAGPGEVRREFPAPAPLKVSDLAILLAVGLLLQLAAGATAAVVPAVPEVVWLTSFALLAAQLPPVRRLHGSLHLGILALNLFFVVIGIGSRIAEILAVGLEIFWFTALVVLIHGLVTYGVARLLRFDLETTSVASQAAVGGPSTAMALAIARNRPSLALPGLMVGLLGYAVGTYAGLAVAALVRAVG